MKYRKKNNGGFTLLETLVVLSIAGFVLVGVTMATISGLDKKAYAVAVTDSVDEVLAIHKRFSVTFLEVVNRDGVKRTVDNPIYYTYDEGSFYHRENYQWPAERKFFTSRVCNASDNFEDDAMHLDSNESLFIDEIPCESASSLFDIEHINVPRTLNLPFSPNGKATYLVAFDTRDRLVNYNVLRDSVKQALLKEAIVGKVELLDATKAYLADLDHIAHYAQLGEHTGKLYLRFVLPFNAGNLKADGSVVVDKDGAGLCWDSGSSPEGEVDHFLRRICMTAEDEDELALTTESGDIASLVMVDTLDDHTEFIQFTGAPIRRPLRVDCPKGTVREVKFLIEDVQARRAGVAIPMVGYEVDVAEVRGNVEVSSIVRLMDPHTNHGVEASNTGVTGYLQQKCIKDKVDSPTR